LARRVAVGDGAGHAALTFDDGLADNLTELAPFLGLEGVPATVFPVSSWLGQQHPDAPWARILTADELRALRGAGVEVGAHTRTHPDLTVLDAEDVRAELVESKRELEDVLDAAVEVAAYPYGRANTMVVDICREAGYLAACRISSQGSWAEPHNLPREDMNRGVTLFALRLKRRGSYEPLMRHLPARAVRSLGRRARTFAGG
jgi:peptidoglycan/xylan/chitin deacetylase (PgdA/CDA1 family)